MSGFVYAVSRFFDRCAGSFSLLAAAILVVAAPTFVFLLLEKNSDLAIRGTETVYRGSVVFTADDWNSFNEAIRNPSHWTTAKSGDTATSTRTRTIGSENALLRPVGLTSSRSDAADWKPGTRRARSAPRSAYGTYRTVCVRLCDGYFWPVSFTTGRDNFRADEKACANTCGSETKLFYYANPGQEPEEMVDLRGRPYSKLRTAFHYTKAYVPNCKCRPDAWEEAATERHQKFAEMERDGTMKTYLAALDKKSRHGRTRDAQVQVAAFGGGITAPAGDESAPSRLVIDGMGNASRYVRTTTRMSLGTTAPRLVITSSNAQSSSRNNQRTRPDHTKAFQASMNR